MTDNLFQFGIGQGNDLKILKSISTVGDGLVKLFKNESTLSKNMYSNRNLSKSDVDEDEGQEIDCAVTYIQVLKDWLHVEISAGELAQNRQD